MTDRGPGPASSWCEVPAAARGIALAVRVDPEDASFNAAELVEFTGDVDPRRVRAALRRVYRDEPGLRVQLRFAPGPQWRQVPWAEFLREAKIASEIDLDAAPAQDVDRDPDQDPNQDAGAPEDPEVRVRRWCRARRQQPLDPQVGRCVDSALIRCGGRWWLYHAVHHLVADGFAAFSALSRMVALLRRPEDPEASPADDQEEAPVLERLAAEDRADSAAREEDRRAWEQRLASWDLEEDPLPAIGRSTTPPALLPEPPAAPEASPRQDADSASGPVTLEEQGGGAVRARVALDDSTQRALLERGRAAGAGWAGACVAAIGDYLARLTPEGALRVGVPQMNRILGGAARVASSRCATAVNQLPVRIPAGLSPERTLKEAAEQLAFNQRHALLRQEEVQRQARVAGGEAFGPQINVIPFDAVLPLSPETGGRAVVHNLWAGPVPGLTVTVRGRPCRGVPVSLEIDGDQSVFTRSSIRAHAPRLLRWLREWAEHPADEPTARLGLCTPEEQRLLDSFAGPAQPVAEPLAQARAFLDQAARTPEAEAVREGPGYEAGGVVPRGTGEYQEAEAPETAEPARFGGRSLTYRELVTRAAALAEALIREGVRPGDPVGLAVRRGVEQFEALCAVLLAGGVYLPLDPELPAGRMRMMLEDARARLVVCGPDVRPPQEDDAETADAETIGAAPRFLAWTELTHAAEWIRQTQPPAPDRLPGADTPLDQTAYILFTSGSTGRPKGVPITHRALSHRIAWQQREIPAGPGWRIAHKTALSFDVHVWELFWAHRVGACAALAAPGGHRDPDYLMRWLAEDEVHVAHFVPTMLQLVLDSPAGRRRRITHCLPGRQAVGPAGERGPRVIVSGEALTPRLVRQCREQWGVSPLNLYGPTEAAIDVTLWDTAEDPEADPVPIGRCVPLTEAPVVDAFGHPAPPEAVGELLLCGVQVTAGYLGREELNRTAFTTDEQGRRAYRTGDLAAWGADGLLRYHGRRDHQVKIGGQRLETAEVESALAAAAPVRQSMVLVLGQGASAELGAVLVCDPEAENEALAEAQRRARRDLPSYMVPSRWITVPRLPVTINGKTDRAALLESLAERPAARAGAASGTGSPEEGSGAAAGSVSRSAEAIAGIFAQSLEWERVGVDESFFVAGGSSLSALDACVRLGHDLGIEVGLAAILRHPTARQLAEHVEHTAAGGAAQEDDAASLLLLKPGERGGPEPLVLCPPAGGLGWCYTALLGAVEPERAVYTLQHPRFADPQADLPRTLTEAARAAADLLRECGVTRVLLGGWSVGGMVAAALTGLEQGALEEQGEGPGAEAEPLEITGLLLLDAYPPEHWTRQPEPGLRDLALALLRVGGLGHLTPPEDPEEAVRMLREQGTAVGALSRERLAVMRECIEAAMAVTRSELPGSWRARTAVVAAEASTAGGADPREWEQRTPAVRIFPVPGAHPEAIRAESVREAFGWLAAPQDTAAGAASPADSGPDDDA